MAAIKDSDFDNLFMTYKNEIYRLAYTYVHNEADALDIVQETAYQAYVSRKTLKDKEKFKSWVLTITVNKSLDYLKKKRPEPVEDIARYGESPAGGSDSLLEFEDSLKTLTLTEKNIVVYKCFFDYTFEMIGETLRISSSTVKNHYYRAIEKLRLEEGIV
jgi:RNA polymerase sigma-70 factor (ECF subfamily)